METISYQVELFHWDLSLGVIKIDITAVSQPSSVEIAQEVLSTMDLPKVMLYHPLAWGAIVTPFSGPSQGVPSVLPVFALQKKC